MSVNYKYLALIITGCIFLFSIIFSGSINTALDFAPLYYSSQILNDGGNIYDFDQLREIIIGHGHAYSAVHYLYPPFLSALIQPLGLLPLAPALLIWLVVNIIALIICFGLIINNFFPNKLKYYIITLGLLIIYYPITFNLQLGQVNPLVLLLLVGGLVFLLKKKEVGSGVLLGLAALIKVFPIIFLFYALFLKKWKIFLSGILTILGGTILTIILTGMNGINISIDYIVNVLPSILLGDLTGWFPGNFTLGYLDILWGNQLYANIINMGVKIIIIIFFIFIGYKYLIKKRLSDTKLILLEFSFLSTLMVIFAAFSFHHYLLWLLIPFIVLFKIYLQNKNKFLLTGLSLAFLFSAIPPVLTKYLLPTHTNDVIYPFINPGLWAIIIILSLLILQYFKKSPTK